MPDNLLFVSPLERALYLKSIPQLQGLLPEQIAVFAEHAVERHFRKGHAIIEAGERVPSFHVVVEGEVDVRGGQFGRGAVVGSRTPLGFLNMLAGEPSALSATAIDDVNTLEVEFEVLLDLLEEEFPILHQLIRRLATMTLAERRNVPDGTYLAPAEGLFRDPGRPLTLAERVLFVRRPGGPFESSNMDGFVDMMRRNEEVRLPAGTKLWQVGDESEFALIIVSGTVLCTTQFGRSRFRAGPGYPLGNLERFAQTPRWYSAVAETPLFALRADTEMFLDLIEDHFDLAMDFVTAMAKGLLRLRTQAAEQEADPKVEPVAS